MASYANSNIQVNIKDIDIVSFWVLTNDPNPEYM